MDKPVAQFFDETESPTSGQAAAGVAMMDLIDEIDSWPAGAGKTWMLNRVVRYIKRVDASVEDLDAEQAG